MDIERKVAEHYTRGGLESAILDALTAAGKDISNLRAADLSAVDEFHLGWRAATVEFAKDLGLSAGMHVLDVGSGIGGPGRYFAEAHGCQVTGIDLTQEFVDVANALTKRCGLTGLASFKQASALEMPFADATFDAATLIHVGMNIADKAALFSEVRRALKEDGRFGLYDIMRQDTSDIPYPMPWAQSAETSFVETPDAYQRLLGEAGFTVESVVNRRDFALKLGREMRENAARHGAPLLGLSAIMGPAGAERIANVMATLERGAIAPVEMICRRSD